MHECDYCGATHDSERAHLEHLKSEHRDELGPIDRRRVGAVDGSDEGVPTGPIALGIVVLASFAIVGYVVFIAGGDGGSGALDHGTVADDGEPYDPGSIHTHGSIEAVIDGEEIDFESDSRIRGGDAFHFHQGYYDDYGVQIYHVHARGVTLQYALETIGMPVNDDGTVLEFDGETYDDGDSNTTVDITIEGEPVEDTETILEGTESEGDAAEGEGDDVRITVETE